jgi:ribonuclease BN (tRNA processing enzyme)
VRLTVVGSGTAAPEPDRVCAAFFIEAADVRVLVDCGPGATHHLARFRLPWQRLDHVVISHFHNDHIGDVPMLLFALMWGTDERRTAPLNVWGPAGLRDRLAAMARAFGDHVRDPGFPVHVHEVQPGDRAELDGGLAFTSIHTPHTEESLAYRFDDASGASLGYTGDTGPSEDVARFLAGVDLLLAECSVPDPEAMEMHLHPTALAAMARTASPGRLVVTHVYPRLDRQDVLALVRAAGWTGPLVRATDGLVMTSPDPAPRPPRPGDQPITPPGDRPR